MVGNFFPTALIFMIGRFSNVIFSAAYIYYAKIQALSGELTRGHLHAHASNRNIFGWRAVKFKDIFYNNILVFSGGGDSLKKTYDSDEKPCIGVSY